MRKAIIALAFYFVMEGPTELPGVKSTTIVHGFKSMSQCMDYRDGLKEFVEAMGLTSTFSPCEEQKAA